MQYVYVLMASLKDNRIPIAVFSNRERAEDAVREELKKELEGIGILMESCDNFLIEEWCVNAFLKGNRVKSLTAYDNRGTLTKRMVDTGDEGAGPESKFSRLMKRSEA